MSKPADIGLIVAADEPALFFSSLAAAESYLEPLDVENGVYSAAYGPTGEPYRIAVERQRVVIRRIADAKPQADKLRSLLQHFLAEVGAPARPSDPLPRLVQLCIPYVTS